MLEWSCKTIPFSGVFFFFIFFFCISIAPVVTLICTEAAKHHLSFLHGETVLIVSHFGQNRLLNALNLNANVDIP